MKLIYEWRENIKAVTKKNRTEFLKLLSGKNYWRPPRLGVLEVEPGETRDYWLADGLPPAGIDVDTPKEDAPTVEFMSGRNKADGSKAMTHVVREARSAQINLSVNGDEGGLESMDAEENSTFLRFENFQ